MFDPWKYCSFSGVGRCGFTMHRNGVECKRKVRKSHGPKPVGKNQNCDIPKLEQSDLNPCRKNAQKAQNQIFYVTFAPYRGYRIS
jgi:hypothetical protein